MPQIEVSFDIDANGIVNVSAQDKATGKEQHITITGGSSLSKEDIDRAVQDAKQYAQDDQRRQEGVNLRNTADHTAHEIRRLLSEHQDRLDDATKDLITQKLEEVERLKENGDIQQLRSALEELQTVAQRMGEVLYSANNANPPPREGVGASQGIPYDYPSGVNPTAAPNSPDDVIDAEYRENP